MDWLHKLPENEINQEIFNIAEQFDYISEWNNVKNLLRDNLTKLLNLTQQTNDNDYMNTIMFIINYRDQIQRHLLFLYDVSCTFNYHEDFLSIADEYEELFNLATSVLERYTEMVKEFLVVDIPDNYKNDVSVMIDIIKTDIETII
jgi:hypothetical protein